MHATISKTRNHFTIIGAMVCACIVVLQGAQSAKANRPVVQEQDNIKQRTGYLIRVQLPINTEVAGKVSQALRDIAADSPMSIRQEDRPIVVLEFDTSGGKTGRGSELEACQSLARLLSGEDLSQLQTIAFVPKSTSGVDEQQVVPSQLNGHAVLVAISTSQLVLAKGTSIGLASVDEKDVDDLLKGIYRSFARKQRFSTLPELVIRSMLESELAVFRAKQEGGVVDYVDEAELAKLEAAGSVKSKTVSKPGELTLLSSDQLVEYGLSRLQPESRSELEASFKLAPGSLDVDRGDVRTKKAIRLDLPVFVDSAAAKWSVRSLRNQVGFSDVNMIIVTFDEVEGDFNGCMRLAQFLAEYDPNEVKTVAFVEKSVRGPAALLAFACDHLVMNEEAMIGGRPLEGDFYIPDGEVDDLKPIIQSLAEAKGTDWSMMFAMLKPGLTVHSYRHNDGRTKLLSKDEFAELDDPNQWNMLDQVDTLDGMDAQNAWKLGVAGSFAADMEEIKRLYGLKSTPKRLQPSSTDRVLEDIAAFLASPFVAPWLLFAGFFFFSTEMSAPGLGLPGFLAAVCFVLFFWSQFLGGNADWVEVILFILGAVFVAMEIFVLPGFGIFGIGGLIMIIISLVLASQSFIIPMNSEEVRQLPYSLMPVLGAGFGIIFAAYALRKILPNSPYLNRLMLQPRKRNETGLQGSDPEAVVDWSHLNGLQGETTTRLFPAGKARIGGKVYDVITKGQMVDKGQKIEVVEAQGNRVVVRAID